MCQRVLTPSLSAVGERPALVVILSRRLYISVTLTSCVACVTLDPLSVGQLGGATDGWLWSGSCIYINLRLPIYIPTISGICHVESYLIVRLQAPSHQSIRRVRVVPQNGDTLI